MPPPGGSICGRLTYDLPLGWLQAPRIGDIVPSQSAVRTRELRQPYGSAADGGQVATLAGRQSHLEGQKPRFESRLPLPSCTSNGRFSMAGVNPGTETLHPRPHRYQANMAHI